MTDWVRLWHDMPTDPKWRVISRKSGQPLACVIAVFNLLMVNASANSAARGEILGWNDEDAGAALDMDGEDVFAIRQAMQGKVLDGDRLTGWEKRQPKREDGTAAARKAAWKERQNAMERNGTQRNAPETETETDVYLPTVDKQSAAANARDALEIADRCIEAMGEAANPTSVGLRTSCPAPRWIAGGADLELDILPVMRRYAGKPRHSIRSWQSWMAQDVANQRATRLTPLPEGRATGPPAKPPDARQKLRALVQSLDENDEQSRQHSTNRPAYPLLASG